MASVTLRRFAKVETLRALQPESLLALLGRYHAHFATRGVDLNRHVPDYKGIADVLMAPDPQTPSGLIDDLYFIDDLATKEAMDGLLDDPAVAAELDLDENATPADVAVQLRLRNPALLEQKHAEFFLLPSRRSFMYFRSRPNADPACPALDDSDRIKALEGMLGLHLEAMKRGDVCKISIFRRPDGVWFLVRRGDPFKREGAIEQHGTRSVSYRPERYDVIRYDESSGELSVNAHGNKKLAELYRKFFGEILFNDAARFPGPRRYTLVPLKSLGEASLVSSDIDGIDWIRLKEVKLQRDDSPYGHSTTENASNVFAAMRQQGTPLGMDGTSIVKASFLVKFTTAKMPRTVVVSGNKATFVRDDDAGLVEEWLERRGFVERTWS